MIVPGLPLKDCSGLKDTLDKGGKNDQSQTLLVNI